MSQTVRVIDQDRLPISGRSHEFEGPEHGGVDVSFILVDLPPGAGPSLHSHPYPEVFIVQEGRASFVVDGEEHEVEAGQVVVVPAGVPHSFVNPGPGQLRQVDIHPSAGFDTRWLEA